MCACMCIDIYIHYIYIKHDKILLQQKYLALLPGFVYFARVPKSVMFPAFKKYSST